MLDARKTATGADIAIPAIVVTEVEQAVDHCREDIDVAVDIDGGR